MTTPRTIQDYGAPAGGYLDALPVEDPTSEQSAAYANRQICDTAQMTNTTTKAIVRFNTTTTAGPIAVTPTNGRSHRGTGSSQLPSIQKVSTGRYNITYSASFTDEIGATETFTFYAARGAVESLTVHGTIQCTVTSNVIQVAVFNTAGSLSDLTNGTPVVIRAT